jgi:hypothetical protein
MFGRALPRKPVTFPGTHRSEKTIYSGNPVATLQVTGNDEGTFECHGKWKDKYVSRGDLFELSGWDSILPSSSTPTVQDIVKIFHSLRRSGNHLEVRWGIEVRRGILKKFEPSWHRMDWVEWMLSFEWNQFGSAAPSPVVSASGESTNTTSNVTSSLSDLNDVMSRIPSFAFPDIISDSLELHSSISSSVLSLVTSASAISGVPSVTPSQFQGIASLVSTVVSECSEMRVMLGDVPPVGLIPVDDVSSGLSAFSWARDVSSAVMSLSVASIMLRNAVRDRTVSDYIADVRLREGQTLRNIALLYYGSADSWGIIADANGLTGSIHPPGTRVLVPRKSGQEL